MIRRFNCPEMYLIKVFFMYFPRWNNTSNNKSRLNLGLKGSPPNITSSIKCIIYLLFSLKFNKKLFSDDFTENRS